MALSVLHRIDQSERSNRIHRARELRTRYGQIECVGLVPAAACHFIGHGRGKRRANRIAQLAIAIGNDADYCRSFVTAADGIEGSHDRTTHEHHSGQIDDVFIVVTFEFE